MTRKISSINQQILIIIAICLFALFLSAVLSPKDSNINHTRASNYSIKNHIADQTQNKINIGERIDQLTEETRIIDYLIKNHSLPDYYITKRQAKEHGWIAKKKNLCQVLPGRAIGGDNFADREEVLPIAYNRSWFEADINYSCGNRGADRIIYSSDGLIYVTHDHYQTFQLVAQLK